MGTLEKKLRFVTWFCLLKQEVASHSLNRYVITVTIITDGFIYLNLLPNRINLF